MNRSFIHIQKLEPISFKSSKREELLYKYQFNRIFFLLINSKVQEKTVVFLDVGRFHFFVSRSDSDSDSTVAAFTTKPDKRVQGNH